MDSNSLTLNFIVKYDTHIIGKGGIFVVNGADTYHLNGGSSYKATP